MFAKILIANRGEIVNRIMRTCSKWGIKTVVVYSDADKGAPYIEQADEAYRIGEANPAKSYLNIPAIVAAVRKSGAEAVHPGYGFLSENGAFARAVTESGAVWIGPSADILEDIESKCYCKNVAGKAGVPVVPGTAEPIKHVDEIASTADKIGYPVILKLDKGGGGKGIEIAYTNEKLKDIFERMGRIGTLAFASSDCYVEKAIIKPRHIEIQFLADGYGNCICLGERECSIQRRYQKIIEESPSPVVTEEERRNLYAYTKRLIQKMGYVGAGTVEYLRDDSRNFYFMEINARLQVEHPVTEFVTGIDLVEQQIRIAAGGKLTMKQSDITLKGHSIECRVYAEDPYTFLPSPGVIAKLKLPSAVSGHVRVEHALQEGGRISPYYDPMLAKVIVWEQTRLLAVNRLTKALKEFLIEGIKTTIPADIRILSHSQYIQGEFNTGFITDHVITAPA